MKVLCIVSYDDAPQGVVTAVVALRDGDDPDDVFVRWATANAGVDDDAPREEVLELPYAWNVKEVETA